MSEDFTTTLSNVTEDLLLASGYEPPQRTLLEQVFNGLIFLAIILTATTGNLLVIGTLTTSSHLRDQVANLFIINLSITDLCSAMVVMCTGFVALVADLRSVNSLWCNTVCAGNYCFIIVSMMTLSAISVERLLAIYCPLRYTVMVTSARVKVICAYTWLQGLAFGCVPVFLHWVHYDYWEAICAIDWQVEKQTAVYYVIVAFVVNFGVPGMVMLVCYLAIVHEAKKHKVHDMAHTPSSSSTTATSDASSQHTKRALKTITSLLVVVLLFFICMTPFCVTKLLKVIVDDPAFVPSYTNLTASYFGYLSSMVNPFIYAIFRRDFRFAFKRTLEKLKQLLFHRFPFCESNTTDSPQEHSVSVSFN